MRLPAFFGAILFAIATPAAAAVWTAELSGANVVAPTASPASGFVTIEYDEGTQTLSFDVNYTDLEAGPVNWRLHCCAGPDVNVGAVIIEFDGVSGTSGSYSFSRDLTAAGALTPAFVTSFGGDLGAAIAGLLAGLNAGETYFIVSTAIYPGGEIRGQLAPVPLPAAAWLFVAGLALLARRACLARV